MTNLATQPPARRRRDDTRRAIVDAGFRLFSTQGYARTSVRDIAAAVGVTDAALYRHFASKKELLDAVLRERSGGNWVDWLEEMRRSVPLADGLEQMALRNFRFLEQNRDFFRLVLLEALAGDPGAVEHHEESMRRWRQGVLALIEGRPGIAAEAAAALAEDYVATIWGIVLQRLIGTEAEPLATPAGAPTARGAALARRVVRRFVGTSD